MGVVAYDDVGFMIRKQLGEPLLFFVRLEPVFLAPVHGNNKQIAVWPQRFKVFYNTPVMDK
jgi:hypothetical protein